MHRCCASFGRAAPARPCPRLRSQPAAPRRRVAASPEPTPPPVEEVVPPWERSERERALQAAAPADLPFGLYLLLSVIVAIAAARTGSLFEWSAGNPVFGVLGSDSPLYGPVLGVFVFTGLPLSAYLFSRCVAAANADSERADKLDGL